MASIIGCLSVSKIYEHASLPPTTKLGYHLTNSSSRIHWHLLTNPSDRRVSEVLGFQTFEKLSPHLARGTSHGHRMVNVGREKGLSMQLLYFCAPGGAVERGRGANWHTLTKFSQEKYLLQRQTNNILTWKVLKSQSKLLNYVPHWFLPLQNF